MGLLIVANEKWQKVVYITICVQRDEGVKPSRQQKVPADLSWPQEVIHLSGYTAT